MQPEQNDQQAPILVLDSGVGGLSVVAEIQRRCPGLPIRYLADNAALPYGDKSESWLVERVIRLVTEVCRDQPIRMIVVACNTASTVVLPALRDQFDIPVVGVVPAIKPAAKLSRSKHIGLLATLGTVKRKYTRELIRQFAADCKINLVGTTVLVTQAERKLAGLPVQMEALQTAMQPLFEVNTLDTIVLGCTHFPLLREELQQITPRNIEWVDSGNAIARRVEQLVMHEAFVPVQPKHLSCYTATYTGAHQPRVERSMAHYGFTTSHHIML